MKNTNRMGRVDEELKKEISHVINFELKNSNITGMISVTKVKVTPDLRYAKVYVSLLGSRNIEKTMQGLKNASGFIRSRVANTVNLRITPELNFVLDDSDIQGEKIDNILKEIKEKDEQIKKNAENNNLNNNSKENK